jgi:small subunit ribosomal protein S21
VPLVHVKEDESFENAMRRFKRKCEKSGILSELKKRQHYEKPSAKRKRKMIQARKKMLRKLAEGGGRTSSLSELFAADGSPRTSSSTSSSASSLSRPEPRTRRGPRHVSFLRRDAGRRLEETSEV